MIFFLLNCIVIYHLYVSIFGNICTLYILNIYICRQFLIVLDVSLKFNFVEVKFLTLDINEEL